MGFSQKEIDEFIRNDKYGFNHRTFDSLNRAEREHDDYITKSYEIEEGIVQCRCGSKRVYSVSIQTRAADEPMSVHAMCTECKFQWTQNC